MTIDEPWPLFEGGRPAEAAQEGRCPVCTYPVSPWASFCEGCSSPLLPTQAPPPSEPSAESGATRRLETRSAVRACFECGAEVGPDGYCIQCGALAPAPRDHLELVIADRLAAVSDRGLVHYRNEDAVGLGVDDSSGRKVLVVCDGVSSSPQADQASSAAAAAATAVLLKGGDPVIASARAAEAITALGAEGAPSCTLALAVIEHGEARWASLGDSRIYWLQGDQGTLLSVDDSVAQEFIAQGMARDQAESMPRAHAITRWLGPDNDDTSPHQGSLSPTGPGWLLVCSDGLWNYASDPTAMASLVAELDTGDPLHLARELVRWANRQGGKDNVSVALAGLEARLEQPTDEIATT